MFSRHKKNLKKKMDQMLWDSLQNSKEIWMRNKRLAEKSMDPNFDLLVDVKVAGAKYFYLLREAKIRKLTANQK